MSAFSLTRSLSSRRRRAAMVLGLVAVVIGLLTFFNALGEPFTIPTGVRLWRLIFMNQLGALLTLGLGVLTLVGASAKRPPMVLLAGTGFGLLTLFTLVTLGTEADLVGGRADTSVLFLLQAVGLITLVTVPDPDD